MNKQKIFDELDKEEAKFLKTLQQGLKEFEKCINSLERKNAFMAQKDPSYVPETVIGGKQTFHLYDTYGFPAEITAEMAKERGFSVDIDGYKAAFEEHQNKSKAGSEQKFACGLADNKEATTKLHTATHLLHAALKKVLSPEVNQKGSNITEERLRFDFNFERPMTKEEIAVIEKYLRKELNAIFMEGKERELIDKVIDDARALMRELDAYDELDGDLVRWYYNKYKSQSKD